MKLKLPTLLSCIVTAILSGCADTDSTNSLITPPTLEPVNAYVIDADAVSEITIDQNSIVSTKPLLTQSTNVLPLDIDTINERDLELFPNDRGASAEFLAYVKASNPSGLYLFNMASQREDLVYDLSNSGEVICGIKEIDVADSDRLSANLLEKKNSLRIRLTVNPNSCSELDTNQELIATIVANSNEYSVRQTDISTGELTSITYSSYEASATTAPYYYFADNALLTNSQVSEYGYLAIDPSAGTSSASLLYVRDPDSGFAELRWLEPITPSQSTGQVSIIQDASPSSENVQILIGDELYLVDKESIFATATSLSRKSQLNTPIYRWRNIDSALPKNTSELDNQTVVVLDGDTLTLIAPDRTIANTKTLNSLFSSFSLVKSQDEIIIQQTNALGDSNLVLVDSLSSVEQTIQSTVEFIKTYNYQDYYDYVVMDDVNSINARFAQTLTLGSPDLNPAIENAAWLPLKHYIENEIQQLMLVSSNTTEGILRSPNIYVYDPLAPNGRGDLKGAIFGDFATIEEAAIIGERFGMIWVRETFEDDAPLVAYYFNPSSDAWSFTKVSENTLFPDWLPYIEP